MVVLTAMCVAAAGRCMPAPTQTSKQQQFECQASLTFELCVFDKEVSHAREGWRGMSGRSGGLGWQRLALPCSCFGSERRVRRTLRRALVRDFLVQLPRICPSDLAKPEGGGHSLNVPPQRQKLRVTAALKDQAQSDSSEASKSDNCGEYSRRPF